MLIFKPTLFLAALLASAEAQVIGCSAGQIGVGIGHALEFQVSLYVHFLYICMSFNSATVILQVGDIWSALNSTCGMTLIDQVFATPPTKVYCGTGATHGTVVDCDAS